MSIFTKLNGMISPWIKIGIDGLQGSGKSLTAAYMALGIYRAFKVKGPVLIYDNEKSAQFLYQMFRKESIEIEVVESASLDVLQQAIKEAERLKTILLIDTLTKVHSKLVLDYLAPFRRKAMEIQDRPIINSVWETGFADIYRPANAHIIFTGRAATDWANEDITDEATGRTKRSFYAKGMKMRGHAETLYEPDYTIYMERCERLIGLKAKRGATNEKEVWREATILKDRSQLLDGQTFRNPTYQMLAPMFEYLLSDEPIAPNVVEGNPTNIFGDDENTRAFFKRRDVALEELDGLLTRALPGQKAEEKQARTQCLVDTYGTASKTKIEGLRPEDIEAGLPLVREWLQKLYVDRRIGCGIDQLPLADATVPASSVAAEATAANGNGKPPRKPRGKTPEVAAAIEAQAPLESSTATN